MGVVKYIFSLFYIVSAHCCAAQPDPILPVPPKDLGVLIEEPLVFPEVMPAYPGGDTQMLKDVLSNLVYPQLCLENEVEGKVFVQFVVEKNGKISNPKILRQPEGDLGELLGMEAIRVVRKLKEFAPGTTNGEPKRVYMTIPIVFKMK